jgi:serine protease Do
MTSRLLAVAVVLAAFTAPASAQLSKDSKLLAPFKPVVAKANESTVRIKCDDKDAILGTIVDADGYILTKLSELRGVIFVRLPDGTEYEAVTVAAHKDTDLALLKVDIKGLKPVKFTKTEKLERGSWVAASGPTSDPISVGIISVMTRKLTGRDAIITNPNRGYMGVIPEDDKDEDGNPSGAKILEVVPNGASDKAGMKVGDVVFEMNGKKITSQAGMRAYLDTLKGGDVVNVKVRRKDDVKELKLILGSAPRDRGDIQNAMGSILSGRRTGFPLVLQTDMVVDAKDCGGPVVDIDGNVLGINIARAGRVETWVLPTEVILPLLPEMKAGKFAPMTTNAVVPPALPVAPAPHLKSGGGKK